MAQASPPTMSGRPTGFIVGVFVLSIVIGGAVLVLGLDGSLGGPIPGTHHGNGVTGPAACEGRGELGTFAFSFVGGEGGSFSFNGTHPGPCVAVAVGSHITVNFSVAANAGMNHTWVLVNASNASTAVSLPAFPGAGFTGAERFMGIAPGTWKVFQFNATQPGSYQYICEMTGHYSAGMWGWFNVSSSPTPASGAPLSAREGGSSDALLGRWN